MRAEATFSSIFHISDYHYSFSRDLIQFSYITATSFLMVSLVILNILCIYHKLFYLGFRKFILSCTYFKYFIIYLHIFSNEPFNSNAAYLLGAQ